MDLVWSVLGAVVDRVGVWGAAGAVLLVVILASAATDPESFNRRAEVGISAAGRFLGGQEVRGSGPVSTATWWRGGVPLPAALGDAAAPAGAGRRYWWGCWPYAARTAARAAVLLAVVALTAPLPAAGWAGPAAGGAAGLAAVLAAAGTRRPAPLPLVHGPALWAVLRPALRLPEDAPAGEWLRLPADASATGAELVLRLPAEWPGGPEARAAVERTVAERLPGRWSVAWDRTGVAGGRALWTRQAPPAPVPVLPERVAWRPSPDPYRVHLGAVVDGGAVVDHYIETATETPHWGVAGGTGAGKSTVLYIPTVHCRMHGGLVSILDTKKNSLALAEGFSGVRVHKTPRECVSALAEFLLSASAAETAQGRSGDPALRARLVPRLLVIDELPTLIKYAYIWWRHGIGERGKPPFLEWFSIALMQGRSSNHRIVVGTHQFANLYFGGTMEREQIGAKMAVGGQDRVSLAVAYGQNVKPIAYDVKIPGRGVYGDKTRDPEDPERILLREIQPAYITPDVTKYLSQCEAAPEWFDGGEMAPWITPECQAEMDSAAALAAFLPGGEYGPQTLGGVAVAAPAHTPVGGSMPSSEPATAASATAGATPAATAAGLDVEAEPAPVVYTLAEAHAAGVIPWKASTCRMYFTRSRERGIAVPEGITDGSQNFYTEQELQDWATAYKEWKKPAMLAKSEGA
ncbi:type IV secretory system conjugative DNA transfer family protein [Streptomyces albidoflavus]|uniref:type IV secretory system conjugative DNA transfer family protein n=1 Tax=Streptomyces albidoflavus TaxID=1886 RepID=UPI00224F3441|nr:type IV secretory system conjugative DNA transfer family protein [Streptomyces albidoflavus]MCX4444549.1 type IV secretory system conjugative DNA transfer family protein [Streptomyces albidoflavus]WTB73762.1 type IV secretory system conjugative DNA transfer family protein [Streptomyces albidoflavus]WTB79415.1 type IV secretory system conjugative DNA transfer family protein [Streptomyces albidoflavus]